MILTELFSSIAKFNEYVAQLEKATTFQTLNASATAARKRIIVILTKGVYESVKTGVEGEKIESLRAAMANLTLANQLIFNTVSLRKDGVDLYKNEQEEMKRQFIGSYYDSMDTLISLLNEEGGTAWKATPYYKQLDKLKIKTADEFDAIYPIDLSYLFFFRCISLQKEVLDERMNGYFSRAETAQKEEVIDALNLALAKMTISKALRRFDIINFPAIIRDLFSDSKSVRNATGEQSQALNLSDQLALEANNIMNDMDLVLSDSTLTDITTNTSFNRPDDKIYCLL